MVVARGWVVGETGICWSKDINSLYKMIKFWRLMYSIVTITTLYYIYESC